MSKPPITPDVTNAGIAVDPRTLQRVIPESRRADGSVRKELKVRPGFTPQEDVKRFRGTRQTTRNATALPKGHIIGWVPPSSSTNGTKDKASQSKSAKKNEKRKEKRNEKRDQDAPVKDDWEDDDDDDVGDRPSGSAKDNTVKSAGQSTSSSSSAAAALTDELAAMQLKG